MKWQSHPDRTVQQACLVKQQSSLKHICPLMKFHLKPNARHINMALVVFSHCKYMQTNLTAEWGRWHRCPWILAETATAALHQKWAATAADQRAAGLVW